MRSQARFICHLFTLATLLLVPMAASAQSLAQKQITVLVAVPPGGSFDIATRIFTETIGNGLGRRIAVDYKPGGAGMIAVNTVKNATPDGSVLLVSLGAMQPSVVVSKGAFDPLRDLQPVTALFSFPSVLAVPLSSKVSSVAELLQLARSKPNGLNFGSQGIGSPQHLMGALLQIQSNSSMTHVAYRGAAPMMGELTAGGLDFAFPGFSTALTHRERIRIIATISTERWQEYPDIPTIGEAGFPKIGRLSTWGGIVAPMGTPRDIVDEIRTKFVEASRNPQLIKRFKELGFEVLGTSSEQMRDIIAGEAEVYQKVIKAMNLQFD